MVHLEDFLPVAICNCNAESLRANFNDSVIDYFDGSEGRPVIEWSDSHLGADAGRRCCWLRSCGSSRATSCFRLDETFYADGLRLVSWSRNHIVPDYFKFHLRRRVVRKEVAAGPDK